MTTGLHRLVASGWSLHLPGADLAAALAGPLGRPPGDWARAEAPPAERAGLVVGRKGLLYKEPATRLALCAVHRALRLPPGRRPDRPVAPRTAVVACSNLGNVETVARVTRTVTAEGGHAVSVLDAPNVSSNVVASTVALWFGFGGPNLMVCSGARAGSDGLWLAGLLLRAGRADRVVLVGAEPDDEVASALYAADDPARTPRGGRATDGPPRTLRAGAACVVLRAWRPEAPGTAREALVELAPGAASGAPPLTVGPGGFDPVRHWGDCYGAQGVVALALAAHLAVDEGFGGVGVPCETSDGSRAAVVAPAGPAAIGGNR